MFRWRRGFCCALFDDDDDEDDNDSSDSVDYGNDKVTWLTFVITVMIIMTVVNDNCCIVVE